MKVAFFSSKSYDKQFFDLENVNFSHDITYFETSLNKTTASLAKGYSSICAFVNDEIDRECLEILSSIGVETVALRCAGFNNVNIEIADALGIQVVRVPEYSPHGVAEHAVALVLGLNRKIYRAHHRVRENNFSLEGLLGFSLNTKTVGVVGTGRIGSVFCEIMKGFGCSVLAYDPYPNENLKSKGVQYESLDELFSRSDIISLHCPLTPETHHLVDEKAILEMRDGVMLINTSRGALVDTLAVIKGLKSGHIGYLGLDVYEEEADLFFEDISNKILEDDVFARLLTFPNVLITGHQGFFTEDALTRIAQVTLQNLSNVEKGIENEASRVRKK